MFGIFKRVRELEDECAEISGHLIHALGQLESVILLASEMFDGLPKAQKERMLERLKTHVATDIGRPDHHLDWLTDDARRDYNDALSAMLQMYIESAEGRFPPPE
jgi:hypothetical protein